MSAVLRAGMDSGWIQWTGLMIPLIIALFKGWMADRQRAREHTELRKEIRRNTELTIVGNDIKSDILSLQKQNGLDHPKAPGRVTK
jgi:hypothetical protein